jgi:hypothetical protein
MAFGIDYSFGNGLSVNLMRAAGVRFVARYLSWQPNSKNINKTEFTNLVRGGMFVVFVWEGTGRDLVNGFRGGSHDAAEANNQVAALGARGCPIYFAPADYDVPPGDQGMINSYLDGAASVIGRGRTGYYGGYWPLKRAADAGKAHWLWQTYAWSGTNVDHRAHLYQYQNAARMGPAEVDFDKSFKADCGWWPRPKVPAPAPAHPAAPAAPAHVAGQPYSHDSHGRDLAQIAHDRGTTIEHLLAVPGNVAMLSRLVIPAGTRFFTSNP